MLSLHRIMKIIEYYGGLPLKIETNFNPFFGKMFQQAYAELVAGEKYCTDLRAELDAERKRVAEIRDELEVAKRVGEAIKKCKSKLEEEFVELHDDRKRLTDKHAEVEALLLEHQKQVTHYSETLSVIIEEIADIDKEIENNVEKESILKRVEGSGFARPTLISDQLAEFLGKDKGSLIARTDVTREINTYIREQSSGS